jgi:hypothetical protein
VDLIQRALAYAEFCNGTRPGSTNPKVAVGVGFALPNSSLKKTDRGSAKITNCDPNILAQYKSWGKMNEANVAQMQSKTKAGRIVRNLPMTSAEAEAHQAFPRSLIQLFCLSKLVGAEVFLVRAREGPRNAAPVSPPKAGPAAVARTAEPSGTAEPSAGSSRPGSRSRSEAVPPAAAAGSAAAAARGPQQPAEPPFLRPKAPPPPLFAVPPVARQLASPPFYAAAVAPPKARPPAPAQGARTAEPAEPDGSNTIGSWRLQQFPQLVAQRRPVQRDSLEWLQQHTLAVYSLGLEYAKDLHFSNGLLARRVSELLRRERPINLSDEMGRRLVADQANADMAVCAVVNSRRGFYDEDRGPGNQHVGYWPQHMDQFTRSPRFVSWLQESLDLLVHTALRSSSPTAEPGTLHMLFWCNRGTHRSVSSTRVWEVVARRLHLGWSGPQFLQ